MLLGAGSFTVDVDVVVFDKDGTLIDNNAAWAGVTSAWIDDLVAEAGDHSVRAELCRAVGLTDDGAFVPNGIAAVEPPGVLADAARSFLAHRGLNADLAVGVMASGSFDMSNITLTPIGAVEATFQRLVAAGFQLAVATSDLRVSTVASLDQLGWTQYFACVTCADDPAGVKPSASVLQHVARVCGVEPQRLVMVGDSVGDVATARNGGAAGAIGVVGGGGEPYGADVYIDSIDAIETR